MSVRVRLAPSPTGPLHVGTARTALFNFLFAKGHDGVFLLRIEDTDRERSKPEFEAEILEGLRWLSLSWDEGPDVGGPHAPYRQSERIATYRAALEQLVKEGKAYESDGAILLNVAPEDIVVPDLIRGSVTFPAREQQDFVIARAIDDPLFHLAVVVDDAAMRITHVIRGEDHLSNTPRHILLQRALGLPTPAYAHVPLLLDQQRKKLSKRTAETGLRAYRDRGYLPEAMVNFLALLGWNPKSTEEVFSLADLVEHFDLAGVQKGGAIFDLKKLDWLQREHGKRLSLPALAERAAPFLHAANIRVSETHLLERALEVWRERGGVLEEVPVAVGFYFTEPELQRAELPWRGTSPEDARAALEFARELIARAPEAAWGARGTLQAHLVDAVDRAGPTALPKELRGAGKSQLRGAILWPLRYALSGRRESPGPGEIAWVLGKEETLRRIQRGRETLERA